MVSFNLQKISLQKMLAHERVWGQLLGLLGASGKKIASGSDTHRRPTRERGNEARAKCLRDGRVPWRTGSNPAVPMGSPWSGIAGPGAFDCHGRIAEDAVGCTTRWKSLHRPRPFYWPD